MIALVAILVVSCLAVWLFEVDIEQTSPGWVLLEYLGWAFAWVFMCVMLCVMLAALMLEAAR